MDWLFYAILAPAIYAIVVFVDKYILEKEITDYRGMPVYSALIASVAGILIWFGTDQPILNSKDAILILCTGVLTIFGLATYFKALAIDEASKITILFQITPILTLIMAYLLLGDSITLTQVLGFMLILISTIGVSLKEAKGTFQVSSTFFLVLITDFLWASAFVLFKFVSDTNSFFELISYECWGIGLGGVMLYLLSPSIRQAFVKTNKTLHKRVLAIIFVNEGFFLLSRVLTYLAISLGPVALVDVVAGTQVFFAIIYGWILTLIVPKIFQEDISKENLIKKILLASLVFMGLWLVQ